MSSSSARPALSLCLCIALAAACASSNTPRDSDRGTIDPVDAFRITAPGLSVTRTADGGIAVQVLRGPSSFSGSNEPLYIIDGTPFQPGPGGSLTGINPHDIESIKLLKDPAETGIYGMRGANGVVVIKTKRPGKSGG